MNATPSPTAEKQAVPADSTPSQWALVMRMLALAWRHRWGSLRVLVQQSLLVALSLTILQMTGIGIDVLRHAQNPSVAEPSWPLGWRPPAEWSTASVILGVASAILVLATLAAWVRYRAAVLVADLTQRIVIQLRTDVYAKLQQLSFRFFDQHESGSIINRVTGDVQAVRMFVDGVIIQFVVASVSLAIFLVYMLRLHVPLTLACLATTPLLAYLAQRSSRVLQPLFKRNRELADKLVLTLSENVQGVQVVKGFGREAEEIAKFRVANDRIQGGKREIFWRLSVFQPVIGGLTQLNLLVLLGYGGWLVMHDQLPLGEGLYVFAQLLQQFATQIGQLANISNSIQTSITGAGRVFEVLDAPRQIASPETPQAPAAWSGRITFEHASFSYDGRHPVLSDITLDVQPGECVAIVGATGAGKSTLLSLVSRFYDVASGAVKVDGVDVRQLDLAQLRRHVGIVFQESFLFSHTIAANVAYGRPDADSAAIESAARLAVAHEFITAQPQGYSTVVGEYGSNLSGGQRQRLAIARALLLQPSILLLDDATTALDPETEHEMHEALDHAIEQRTTLVVAHRLSTLRRADRIVVLEQGRIVQQGTHDELLRVPGHYRDNARLQIFDDTLAETSTRSGEPA